MFIASELWAIPVLLLLWLSFLVHQGFWAEPTTPESSFLTARNCVRGDRLIITKSMTWIFPRFPVKTEHDNESLCLASYSSLSFLKYQQWVTKHGKLFRENTFIVSPMEILSGRRRLLHFDQKKPQPSKQTKKKKHQQ